MMQWTYNRDEGVYIRRDEHGRDRGQVWNGGRGLSPGQRWRYTGSPMVNGGARTMREAKLLCVDPREIEEAFEDELRRLRAQGYSIIDTRENRA